MPYHRFVRRFGSVLLAFALLAPGVEAGSETTKARPSPAPFRAALHGEDLADRANRIARDPRLLVLRDWAFDPIAEDLPRLSPFFERSKSKGSVRVVQFGRAIDREIRGALRALDPEGVHPLAAMPNNSVVVRLAGAGAEGALRRLPALRWIGPWTPAFRVAGELVRADPAEGFPVRLLVELWPGGEPERIVALAASASARLRVLGRGERPERLRLLLELPPEDLPELLARIGSDDAVAAVDPAPLPILANDNSVWVVQSWDTVERTNYALSATIWNHGLTGTGQVAAVADTGLDSDMCFFRRSGDASAVTDEQALVPPATGTIDPSKKVLAYYTEPGAVAYEVGAAGHGTHVSGSIVGDNWANLSTPTSGGHDTGDGMAPNGRLVFQDIGDAAGVLGGIGADLAPLFEQARDAGAAIHNDSWGDGQPRYTPYARDMDDFTWGNETFLFTVANGNSGGSPSDGSIWAPATAKNVLSVGLTTNGAAASLADDLVGWSSRGPVVDGRRKPDLVAPGSAVVSANSTASHSDANCSTVGKSGTSMAAPTVAGALLLARQYFVEGWNPTGAKSAADALVPSAALLKAVAIDGALPLGGKDLCASCGGAPVSKIPSFDQGWGRIHLDRALSFAGDPERLRVRDTRNRDGLETGETRSFEFDVPSGHPFRATLAWSDPGASSATGRNLVNDLDLEAESPGGTTYRGNVFASGESTPGGSADSLNPVEQILLTSPEAGVWTVRVVGRDVPGSWSSLGSQRQGFGLAMSAGSGCTAGVSAAPTGLVASAAAGGVALSWVAAAGASRYAIFKGEGDCTISPSVFTFLAETGGTSFLDATAQGGGTVAYVVRAIDGCGESPPSTCASVFSTGSCDLPPSFAGAGAAVDASAGGVCRIDLSWSPAASSCPLAPGIVYNVYRGSSPLFVPSAASRVATGLGGTSWSDTGVPNAETVWYVVRAEDATTANGGPANGGNEDRNVVRLRATATGGATSGVGTWRDGGGDGGAKLLGGEGWSITSIDNSTPGGAFCYRSAAEGWAYPPDACAAIRTPPLLLAPGESHPLAFRARWNLEYQWDGVVVEISSDAGGTWQDLGDTLGLLSPAYPTTLAQTRGNGCAFPSTRKAFSGPAGNGGKSPWALESADLALFDGTTIEIRWRLTSDAGAEFDGFFLDDLSIGGVALPAGCGIPREVSPAGSTVPLVWTSDEALVWESLPFVSYVLYRATEGQLHSGTSGDPVACALATASGSDASSPGPDGVFFYSVAARNVWGEGIAGRDSAGTSRPPASSCP
jgi:hypothetical protein